MNVALVKAAAEVITCAQQRRTTTPAGVAIALDAAQLLQSPETVEQVRADALEQVRAEREEAEGVLRARVAELETELAKYAGAEPTIAEEMAYLSARLDAVAELELPESLKTADGSAAPEYRCGYEQALADMHAALDGAAHRTAYPPVLPWARLMDDEDLTETLGEVWDVVRPVIESETTDPRQVLAELESILGSCRARAEAQHTHNTAPSPDRDEAPDGITRLIAPSQALREDIGSEGGAL